MGNAINLRASTVSSASVFLFSAAVLLSGNVDLAYAQSALETESLSNSTGLSNNFDPYSPVFTPYAIKQAITANPGFTNRLLANAERYIPWIANPNTQAHMGFWSGPGNRGNLIRVLSSINFTTPPLSTTYFACGNGPSPAYPEQTNVSDCAIWDEGAVEAEQYPLYVEMLKEHWYDRGTATDAGRATVSIYGVPYPNQNRLTFAQADTIWGQYSQRYADMAVGLYQQTKKPVKVWAFLGGASKTRIFFTYEYPELQKLETLGYVIVNCTLNPNAVWTNPNDWTIGTTSNNCSPQKALAAPPEVVDVWNRK